MQNKSKKVVMNFFSCQSFQDDKGQKKGHPMPSYPPPMPPAFIKGTTQFTPKY